MKILLINPVQTTSYPQPPLGLALLAAVVKRNSHLVKIVDLTAQNLSENDVDRIMMSEKPKIVGITAMTSTIKSALRIAQKVKKIDTNVIVVLGGAHVSILPEETLRVCPEIDIIVRGEGEVTFLELVEVLEKNGDLSCVLGLTYRIKSGFKNTNLRPPITALDDLPFPAFELLPTERYRLHPPFGRKSPAMPIITSRGCPYSCIFCSKSVFGNKYRSNSTDYVIDQIRFLKDNFGIKEIKFYDDVFTLDRKWVETFCNDLRRQNLVLPWTCETRVNLVDEDLLQNMKSAGCYMIAYGVESGSQPILNSIGKKTTLDQIAQTFKITHYVGINTVAYFMLGVPLETLETIKSTIEFAKYLDPDFVQFSIATPYPGTELNRLSKQNCASQEWDAYVYADLKSVGTSNFNITSISREELSKWNRKAYNSFYLRRKYVWKRMKRMTSFSELKTNIVGLRMLLNMVR